MVFITYSQKWARDVFDARIRRIWSEVTTASTPDLWLKIFIYRDKIWYNRVDERWYQYDETIGKNVEVAHPGLKRMDKARVFFGDKYNFDDMVLLKVLPAMQCRGNYRCAQFMGHGFYDKEWKFIHKHPKIQHCITLKIGESASDRSIALISAHEYRHYRQWKKYGAPRMAQKRNGRRCRPVKIEKDAEDWELKRIKQLGY